MNISIKDAANILCMTERAVRYRCQNGEYIFTFVTGIGGNSGLQIMIDLSSLPPEAQKRYYELHDTPAPEELSCDDLLSKYSGKQLRDAEFKIGVVRKYRRDKRNNDSKLSVRAFLRDFNQHSEMQVIENQMYSWIRLYHKGGLEALIDNRGGNNRGESLITEEQWELFKSLYLKQQQLSVSRCYQIVKKKYPDSPSITLFERKARTIPEYAKIRYRFGEIAFRDSLPYMERDKSEMHSNEVWDSDHHLLDFFCRGDNGQPVRMWLTTFADFCSSKIMAHIAYEGSPSTSSIKRCLRLAVEKNGVPETIYTDNGKDYTSAEMNADFPYSIYSILGIDQILATPYHGQAKPIERFHRTLEEDLGKLFPTYAGKDAKSRPECMRITNKQLSQWDNLPSKEEALHHLNKFINEYNARPSSSLGGRSPNDVYSKKMGVIRTVSDQTALRLLCCRFDQRTVQRNGVQIMGKFYQDNEGFALTELYKRKVIVGWEPDDIDIVFIFDLDMRFLCRATAKDRPLQGRTTEEQYRAHKRQRKHILKLVKEYKPIRTESPFDMLYSSQDAVSADEIEPERQVELIIKPHSEAAKVFGDTAPAPAPRKRKQSLFANMCDYYEKEDETCQATSSKKHKLA